MYAPQLSREHFTEAPELLPHLVLSGKPYAAPPSQIRFLPTDFRVTSDELAALADQSTITDPLDAEIDSGGNIPSAQEFVDVYSSKNPVAKLLFRRCLDAALPVVARQPEF
jgi:hypothetical protein